MLPNESLNCSSFHWIAGDIKYGLAHKIFLSKSGNWRKTNLQGPSLASRKPVLFDAKVLENYTINLCYPNGQLESSLNHFFIFRYKITTIVLQELKNGHFSLKKSVNFIVEALKMVKMRF